MCGQYLKAWVLKSTRGAVPGAMKARAHIKMDTETARIVTRLLELVVKGNIEPTEALAQWPQTADAEPVFGAAWHDLTHFAADDDIRQKDERTPTIRSP